MSLLAIAIGFIPTIILGLVVLWVGGNRKLILPLGFAFFFGMLTAIPVFIAEIVIEGAGDHLTNIYQQALIQQVLGAALCEEIFICLALLATVFFFRGPRISKRVDIVRIAVAVAVGFTTVENILAVVSSPTPMTAAISRLSTLFAGHATLQLVMGFFAANVWFDQRRRLLNGCLMLLIPLLLHGWGDFTETVFHALEPDSQLSKRFFSAWILGLVAYVAAGVTVLWILCHPETARPSDSDSSDSDSSDSDSSDSDSSDSDSSDSDSSA